MNEQISGESVLPGCTATAGDFIAAAREFLGVRYHPQARSKDGMDCGGLLLACGRIIGYTELEVLGYSSSPDGQTFERLLEESLTEVPRNHFQPGDVLAVEFKAGLGIQHTAIVVDIDDLGRPKVVHATRKNGVCEQRLYGVYEAGWVKTYRLRHLV